MATSMEIDSEYRVLVVGKTGSGKSSLCNSLSGKRVFKPSHAASATQKFQKEKFFLPKHKTVLEIIDTPDLFDFSRIIAVDEIIKLIILAAPGPHVFLFVLNIRRFAIEEQEYFERLETLFDDAMRKYVIVVFTGTDELEDFDDDGIEYTLEDHISYCPRLRELLRKCGNRYVGISNKIKHPSHEGDVDDVLRLIRKTVELNDNQFYDHKMFKDADKIIQMEVDKQKENSPLMSIREIREEIEKEIGPLSELIKAALPIVVNVASSQCTIS